MSAYRTSDLAADPGRASAETIANAGHFVQEDAGEEAAERIVEFLAAFVPAGTDPSGSVPALKALDYEKRQVPPAANSFRIRRLTTIRCTSSGPS